MCCGSRELDGEYEEGGGGTGGAAGGNNIGVGIDFKSEDAGGSIASIGRIESILSTATANSEVGDFNFKVADGTNPVTTAATLNKLKFELKDTSAEFKIDGASVLSKTALGATVVSSSLTSVGTLSSLSVTGQVTVDGNIAHTGSSDLTISASSNDVKVEGVTFSGNAVTGVSTLAASSGKFTASTQSTSTTTGAVVVTGGVGIGGALHVAGTIKSGGVAVTSDRRWKKDIRVIDNASKRLLENNVRGVYYNFKTDEFPRKKFPKNEQIGVIAQDIEKSFPNIVHTNENGYKSVEYGKISAILIEVANEQNKRIELLESKYQNTKTANQLLQNRNQYLQLRLYFMSAISLFLIPYLLVLKCRSNTPTSSKINQKIGLTKK